MTNLNTNPSKTLHLHVPTLDVATSLIAALSTTQETVERDHELSQRAGYPVQIVTFDRFDPSATVATISHLGHRFEINYMTNGATTCIWWDEM